MDILLADIMGKPLWMWLVFLSLVLLLLVFDLGVLHRKCHEIGMRESLLLSCFYIGLGVAFSGWIAWHLGGEASVQYLTGFVVEKSLAMDNIFVIAMIFAYFGTPRMYQHRVLVFGILGVIVLRAVMIAGGAALLAEFEWVLYVFAAILVFTGVKMLLAADETYDVGSSPILAVLRRRLRVADGDHGDRFFVRLPHRRTGKVVLFATPLFLALAMVELADVVFAVDSIPAIFAITTDPYIVYTSNIFAILGLRALYFALSAMLHRFVYLNHALALVLVFIGGKIFVTDMLDLGHLPPVVSLVATLTILGAGVVCSLLKTRAEGEAGCVTADRPPAAVQREVSSR